MGSSKWNALDDVLDALEHIESIECFDAGLYENSHKGFKKVYMKMSKKQKTSMEEVLRRKATFHMRSSAPPQKATSVPDSRCLCLPHIPATLFCCSHY